MAVTCEPQTADLDPGTVVFLTCTDRAGPLSIYLSSFEDAASLDSNWSRTGEPGLSGAHCESGRFDGVYAVDGRSVGRIKCFDYLGPVVAWTIDDVLASGWVSSVAMTGDPAHLYAWWLRIAPVGRTGAVELGPATSDPGGSGVDAAAYLAAALAFNDGYRALLEQAPGSTLDAADLPVVAGLVDDLKDGLAHLAAIPEADAMDHELRGVAELVLEFREMPPTEADGLTFLVDYALRDRVSPLADAMRRLLHIPPRDEGELV